MKNNKGFTLVEIIGVVVIIGVVMLIAIPAVSEYMISSRKSSYISNVRAFVETIRGEYQMKNFGTFLYDDEIMLVPIEAISLDSGDTTETPFGTYDYEKSYIAIVPERNTYQYYAYILDSAGYGVVGMPSNAMSKEYLDVRSKNDIVSLMSFVNYEKKFSINGKTYEYCEGRDYITENGVSPVKILVLCEE